ncbi:hypothetical protein PSEUBRA_003902 [Kalmanozyma brasiliensis GHG001]|uniref:uncharacterized protein n=1 Tax=Kalmanozyma brasiliensis (strain GHG001) TaxID=1365824 RepID=UPI002868236C|nr:uncharacterized protein PSEUBRA_003902 [Kalmanozyma brasiliensis GHG001]EST06045.2 hypothetical protein PSEUBRA_003902 [Kalmanozyma brasiliensis GHG001]
MLPSDRATQDDTTSSSTWSRDPALASPLNALPPRYDTHQFPPTPPALYSARLNGGSYFDQGHLASPDQSLQLESAFTPSEPPPNFVASRFPRWGPWLEKRALERHYARLEIQQQADSDQAQTPNRKKSWGAWVNDPDAISDDLSASTSRDKRAADHTTPPPSLHLHHFGSRFLPHLPTQPLCSVLIELPAQRSRAAQDNEPNRQILLVGTATGLFAIQTRASSASSLSGHPGSSTASSSNANDPQWNHNIRCLPIWTGLAVYQLCILASSGHQHASSSRAARSSDASNTGVLLALTCPSSAKDGFLTSSLMQLSAHAGSVLDSVSTTGSSSSAHNSHAFLEGKEGVAAANFGSTAGGGPGRAVPPGGAGLVRMWHLQAIRELLVYALDEQDAQLPINLAEPSSSNADKRAGLSTMLKKTFARQKGRSGDVTSERRPSDSSLSATVHPLPRPGSAASSQIGEPNSLQDDSSPQSSPPSAKRQREAAHAVAKSLAQSSVPIRPPSHATSASPGQNASFSSLFADDLIQSFSATRQTGGKGKDRDADALAASKGVLFFSVHEADKHTKGTGTWYLAITYARSVMVYEASIPDGGSARAWSFVKELYAPFPIKAVAFTPASVSDITDTSTSPGPVSTNASTTILRVASAQGPLLTSKKAPHREQGRQSGHSSPVKPSRGSAAPASWHKADLCLMLSFGRRAVLVRLRDSHVREMELKPLAQIIAAASDGSESTMEAHLSLQKRAGQEGRPLSMVADAANVRPTDRQLSTASGHSRTSSVEQKLRDVIVDKRSTKHNWTGFSSVEARIFVRQWSEAAVQRYGTSSYAYPAGQGTPGPSLTGLSMPRGLDTTSTTSLARTDKELPRIPAPQNASFDRRDSQLHLSEQHSQYHSQLQADSDSDDGDDGLERVDKLGHAAKYHLTDPGPWPLPRTSDRPAAMRTASATPTRSLSLPPMDALTAKLALASRGGLTHVLRLPIVANVADTNPLAVMQWSDTPNAVSGWARVLGVERASTKGATTLGQLKQTGTAFLAPEAQGPPGDSRAGKANSAAAAAETRRKNNSLVLHIGVTCVAFLASRIESRKVSFKMPLEADFDLLPESELELIPLSPDTGYLRANGSLVQATEIEAPEAANDESPGGEATGSAMFTYPAVHTVGPASAGHSSETSAISQELEYLCAPLLTLNPIDLDLHSCGAQSLVLPLSHAPGQESAANAMLPDLAGDAGIIAFDWRGADDFRIFTVGIAG